MCFFFFKQKTAYEMRISDWSSDVCSSDLLQGAGQGILQPVLAVQRDAVGVEALADLLPGEIRASRVLEAVHDAGADGIGHDHEYLGHFLVVDRIVELTERPPDAEADDGAPPPAEELGAAACGVRRGTTAT